MRFVSLVVVIVGLSAVDAAVADHRTVRRYPRVYGATGRPYGPTQAHYQYQRQYGRSWHGYGGSVRRSNFGATFSIGYYPQAFLAPVIVNGYGIGGSIGYPGYVNYGPTYGYPSPIPQSTLGNPFNNDALRRAQLENDLRWQTPLTLKPAKSSTQPKRFPSSPVAKLKSLHAQGRGDLQLHKQEYREAYKLYRDATRQAPDRAEAQFRLAFSLVCLGQFQAAIPHFKRGLELDPALPVTGISLGKLLGRDNTIAKNTVLSRVTAWTKEDIRDPDRLFVLGVMLHYDNRADQSAVVFEAAYRLAGSGEHLAVFLRAQKLPIKNGPASKTTNVLADATGTQKGKPTGIIEIAPPVPPIESEKKTDGVLIVPPLPNP